MEIFIAVLIALYVLSMPLGAGALYAASPKSPRKGEIFAVYVGAMIFAPFVIGFGLGALLAQKVLR